MPLNVAILLVALAAATLAGLAYRRRTGHFRGAVDATEERAAVEHASVPGRLSVTPTELRAELGERATLLQFSSAFCAPCRATRHVLDDVADVVPGVAHVELDAEHHLDLVRRLGVHRTPTTFVLDARGGIVTRASGAPTKQAVLAALGPAVDVTD